MGKSYDRLIKILSTNASLAIKVMSNSPIVINTDHAKKLCHKHGFWHILYNPMYTGKILDIIGDSVVNKISLTDRIEWTVDELERVFNDDQHIMIRQMIMANSDAMPNLSLDVITYLYSKGIRRFHWASWCVATKYNSDIVNDPEVKFLARYGMIYIHCKYIPICMEMLPIYEKTQNSGRQIDLSFFHKEFQRFCMPMTAEQLMALFLNRRTYLYYMACQSYKLTAAQIRELVAFNDDNDARAECYVFTCSIDEINYDYYIPENNDCYLLINNPHADQHKVLDYMLKHGIDPMKKTVWPDWQVDILSEAYNKDNMLIESAALRQAKVSYDLELEVQSLIRDIACLPEDYFALTVMYCDDFFTIDDQ